VSVANRDSEVAGLKSSSALANEIPLRQMHRRGNQSGVMI
jgi:hypothetical protein